MTGNWGESNDDDGWTRTLVAVATPTPRLNTLINMTDWIIS